MKQIIRNSILGVLCAMTTISLKAAETEVDSLKSDSEVQVAFRKVAQSDLMGSISTIEIDKLQKKNFSTNSLDHLQGYIGGFNGNSIWGNNDYLILIDGIARSADNVKPDEIVDITVLKSAASSVLYGSTGAKGIIYITTKRGKVTDGLDLDIRVNTEQDFAKSYPEYLGAAEYMAYYNEARVNDGLNTVDDPFYSMSDIYNYSSGENPYRYSDVDLYSKDYINNSFNTTSVSAQLTGGSEKARFYSNIGYSRAGNLIDFGQYSNAATNRLNIRGNVDININEYISAYVNTSTVFWDKRAAQNGYWSAAAKLRPNRISPLVPLSMVEKDAVDAWKLLNNSQNIIDGQYFLGGSQSDKTNVFADVYAAGYKTTYARQFQFDTGINIDLEQLTEGLSFGAMYSVDYANGYTTSYTNEYATFAPIWSNVNGHDSIIGVTQYGTDKKSGTQDVTNSSTTQTKSASAQFNYKRTFDNLHNVSAMLVANGYQVTATTVYQKALNANLGIQASYDYDKRYYFDFSGAMNYSTKLAPGNRTAFSPTVTLGWKIGNEQFLEDSIVDDLTFSLSAGKINTDVDITDYFLYTGSYNNITSQWAGWGDSALVRVTSAEGGENLGLDFITREELSANIRTSLWDNTFTFDGSVFYTEENGLVTNPSSLFPSYFVTSNPTSTFIPYVNYENNVRSGVEFNATYNDSIGEVDFSVGVAATYNWSQATKRNELYDDEYQNRTGKSLSTMWGLQADGFYNSQEEIDAIAAGTAPKPSYGEVQPGDIKYIDQNGDNVIDKRDQIALGLNGSYGAPLTTGLNLSVSYKNFSLFALATARFGASAFKNDSYWWVSGEDKYSAVVRNRWTPASADTATYPRLTTGTGANNFISSSFWMYSTNRFDLHKVQLTYDFPDSMFRGSWVKGLSAYLNGSNLLTIAKEREVLEMSVGSAPLTRSFSLGVTASF